MNDSKSSQPHHRWSRAAVLLAGLAAFLIAGASRAQSEPAAVDDEPLRVTFYQVSNDGTEAADRALQSYIEASTRGVQIESERRGYEDVIRALVDLRPGEKFVARVTPYVFAVAEMLGAEMEVVATYVSRKTGSSTYRSYFVVHREAIGMDEPSLEDVEAFLEARSNAGRPAEFLYHSRFSTSSYFVPSRFLRERRIFDSDADDAGLIRIRSRLLEDPDGDVGSTDLVRAVAEDPDLFAAVWDGTMAKFLPGGAEHAAYGDRVVFVPLDTVIPNDLLVASPGCKEKLARAIHAMRENTLVNMLPPGSGSTGDFHYWIDPEEKIEPDPETGFTERDAARRQHAEAARTALSSLRRLSRERTAAVTVDIVADEAIAEYVQAAESALALSGSELVRYDPDFHSKRDVIWRLEPVHAGAVRLETEIVRGDPELEQSFRISFRDGDLADLSRRIGYLIHERMHRVRYLWPYWSAPPTLIRDVPFRLAEKTELRVERIRWIDPEANRYEPVGQPMTVPVRRSDLYKFELEGFDGYEPSPLSDVAHRVVLVRSSRQSLLLSGFTALFVVLLVAAAAGAVWEARRRTSPRRVPPRAGLPSGATA